MEVILTQEELFLAATEGIIRQSKRIRDGSRSINGEQTPTKTWGGHIEGALGELALSKFLNAYWTGLGGIREPDVAGKFEVRTSWREDAPLVVRREDADDKMFVLLVGYFGKYRIAGCIQAIEAKKEQYLSNRGILNRPPAYFVPQSDLMDFKTIAATD